MEGRVCIIGSGPTGVFTLKNLITSPIPLTIDVFDAEPVPGKGTPYLPGANDPVMLSNIPSVEIPLLIETLVDWLYRQDDDYLSGFNIVRGAISERTFFPRLVLGDYFHDQFKMLVAVGKTKGHRIDIHPCHRVTDIILGHEDIRISVSTPEEHFDSVYDHVVMATGHNWPETTEVKPGYFASPWPSAELAKVHNCKVGILGTSLSGIDAVLTVATNNGSFVHDEAGNLRFFTKDNYDDFCVTMMSRKGLLPEADFYCPLPYRNPQICTQQAVQREIDGGTFGLLDRVFELFRRELFETDPDYAAQIGLRSLTVETFAEAYYGRRSDVDPFVWAAANLAEAQLNFDRQHTVPWRYAILVTHEIIELMIPHLDTTDLERFARSFKSIFIDEYATVPHLSIQRLLALRNAGKLEVWRLGDDYDIDTGGIEKGAIVCAGDRREQFENFIDATGQSSLSATDLPFPTLVAQRGVDLAATPKPTSPIAIDGNVGFRRTGGIEVDDCFRPRTRGLLSNRLYCVAIPFLLHKRPFVQGITSAAELGKTVADAIVKDVVQARQSQLVTA